MKFSISEAFRDRKFKYSGMATILVIAVVLVALTINLLCSLIPYRLDVTANKMYSISDKTMSIINRLDKDIDIYFLYQAGGEDDDVMEIASRYATASNHIRTRVVDPIANPGFVNDYLLDPDKQSTTPAAGTVIVECKELKKFQVLSSNDFYSYAYDDEDSSTVTMVYFNAEQAFTSAIVAVTCVDEYNVAVLTGHNEDEFPEEMKKVLSNLFINFYDVDLQTEEIPEQTDVLLVLTPEFDILDVEKEKILAFLDSKDTCGSALFIMGKATTPTPNFDYVMSKFGIELDNEIIYEEDTSRTAAGLKYAMLMPYNKVAATDYTGVSQRLYLEKAKPIYALELVKNSTVIQAVANTSSLAWSSSVAKSGTIDFNLETDTLAPSTGFTPIVAVTDYGDAAGVKYSRVFVANCAGFMLKDQTRLNAYSNDEVFYSGLFWCLDSDSTMVTLTPKYYITSTHTLATKGLYVYAAIIGIAIPIGILILGLVIFLKRRHL